MDNSNKFTELLYGGQRYVKQNFISILRVSKSILRDSRIGIYVGMQIYARIPIHTTYIIHDTHGFHNSRTARTFYSLLLPSAS